MGPFRTKTFPSMEAFGIKVPEKPGQCVFQNGLLLNRMNRTQTAIWNLSADPLPLPDHTGFTLVTDATTCLALVGKNIFSILEKLSSLDFSKPGTKNAIFASGSGIPCSLPGGCFSTTHQRNRGVIFTCSRGYARDMVNGILEAGEEFGLKPAGEAAFHKWLEPAAA